MTTDEIINEMIRAGYRLEIYEQPPDSHGDTVVIELYPQPETAAGVYIGKNIDFLFAAIYKDLTKSGEIEKASYFTDRI